MDNEGTKQKQDLLHPVYRELSEKLGMEVAAGLYELFKGQQISFPVRLYDPLKVKNRILQEYDGFNIRALAARYDYSEKTIRRILNEKKPEKK